MPGDHGTFTRRQCRFEHGVEIGGQVIQAVAAAPRRDPAAAVAAVVEGDHPVVLGEVGDLVGPHPEGAGDAVREHDGITVFGAEHLGVQPDAVPGAHVHDPPVWQSWAGANPRCRGRPLPSCHGCSSVRRSPLIAGKSDFTGGTAETADTVELNGRMRAIQIARLDGPQAADLVEIDEPTGEDGSVLVDVHAAGVAFPDALQSRGLYQYKPEMPYIPGAEIAGVVRSARRRARAPGDRVAGLTMLCGAMAEVVALQPERLFKLPDSVSFEAGAGLLFNDLTVHFALRTRGRLSNGDTVLVHGAAGGIGTSTLRLAPAFGAARTIAVVSSEEKSEVARAAGASEVVLADGFKDAVKELTDGRGVDIVVDPVGGDRFTDSLRCLAPGGRLLVVGFTGGEIPTVKVNRLLLNNVDVVGVGWGAWTMSHPGYLPSSGPSWSRFWPRAHRPAGSGGVPARARRRGDRLAGGPDRAGQGRRQLR